MLESEDILIQKCIEWNASAQNRLYEIYASRMLALCFRYSRNREEAEDTLHEGFMKVFENIQKFRKEGSLEGWIRKIMYNTAIYKYRQRKDTENTISMDSNSLNLSNQSSEETLSKLGTKELLKLIQNLPPRYQMVFNLYVFEGLKHREIAEHLGITEGTSKSNLSDARTILQREVNKSVKIPGTASLENGR